MSSGSTRSPWRAERFDPEARRLDPLRPAFEASLRHQMAHEVAAVGHMLPDARQEERPPASGAEDEAVAVGIERGDEARPRFPPELAGDERGWRRRGGGPRARASLRAENRGSENAACTAFVIASSISGRRGAGDPIQPLSPAPGQRDESRAHRGQRRGEPSVEREGRRPAAAARSICEPRHGGRQEKGAVALRRAGPRRHIRARRRRSRRPAPRPRRRRQTSPDAVRSPACRARRRFRARP